MSTTLEALSMAATLGTVRPGQRIGLSRAGTPAMRADRVRHWVTVAHVAQLPVSRARVTLAGGRTMTASAAYAVVVTD